MTNSIIFFWKCKYFYLISLLILEFPILLLPQTLAQSVFWLVHLCATYYIYKTSYSLQYNFLREKNHHSYFTDERSEI